MDAPDEKPVEIEPPDWRHRQLLATRFKLLGVGACSDGYISIQGTVQRNDGNWKEPINLLITKAEAAALLLVVAECLEVMKGEMN
jgi:hypothetical protein